jgi:hypothetical protein
MMRENSKKIILYYYNEMDYKTNELFKFDKIVETKQYELLQYQTEIKKNSPCIPVI